MKKSCLLFVVLFVLALALVVGWADPVFAGGGDHCSFGSCNTTIYKTYLNKTVNKTTVNPIHYVNQVVHDQKDWEIRTGIKNPTLVRFTKDITLEAGINKDVFHTTFKEGWEANIELVWNFTVLDFTKKE